MPAPVPPRRRATKKPPPPRPADVEPEPLAPVPIPDPDLIPLPQGLDPDALAGAWFDHCTEHEAEREVRDIKARTDWVIRDARQRRAYELRINARLTYRAIGEQLGIDTSTAYKDVATFAAASAPISEREIARRESVELYERLLRQMLLGMSEVQGQAMLPWVDRLIQVQGKLDKSHGVDAPPAVVDPNELGTVDDIDAAANQLVAEMDFLARNNLLSEL